jgi:hypothetical protein
MKPASVTKDCKQSQSSFELREMLISRAFLYIAFMVPTKEAHPPGSPNRAPTERDAAFPEPSFNYISKLMVNGHLPPLKFPNGSPMEREMPVSTLLLQVSPW